MIKVIIAGGRDFNNFELLVAKVDNILKAYQPNIEIVSGGQITISTSGNKYGADYFGEVYATIMRYKRTKFKADWDKYGKSAGPIRNKEMADYSDALIAFWDGKSKGTKGMISLARDKGIPVRIIKY